MFRWEQIIYYAGPKCDIFRMEARIPTFDLFHVAFVASFACRRQVKTRCLTPAGFCWWCWWCRSRPPTVARGDADRHVDETVAGFRPLAAAGGAGGGVPAVISPDVSVFQKSCRRRKMADGSQHWLSSFQPPQPKTTNITVVFIDVLDELGDGPLLWLLCRRRQEADGFPLTPEELAGFVLGRKDKTPECTFQTKRHDDPGDAHCRNGPQREGQDEADQRAHGGGGAAGAGVLQ